MVVAADGSALVVWGEAMPDGRTHVIARRIYGTSLSALPQDATLPEGGSADSPEVDIEYDRTYAWVAFRQDVGGVSRSFARQLRASSFQAPIALDAGVASSQSRRLDELERHRPHAERGRRRAAARRRACATSSSGRRDGRTAAAG